MGERRDATRPWERQAACADPTVPVELFFPNDSRRGAYDQAKRVCRGCTVRRVCLDDALAQEGDHARTSGRSGVWGGRTPYERAQIGRCRRGTCHHLTTDNCDLGRDAS